VSVRKFPISNRPDGSSRRAAKDNKISGGTMMLRRTVLKGLAGSLAVGLRTARAATGDDVLKMGVSLPLTGAG
jgi:hypothetical protein